MLIQIKNEASHCLAQMRGSRRNSGYKLARGFGGEKSWKNWPKVANFACVQEDTSLKSKATGVKFFSRLNAVLFRKKIQTWICFQAQLLFSLCARSLHLSKHPSAEEVVHLQFTNCTIRFCSFDSSSNLCNDNSYSLVKSVTPHDPHDPLFGQVTQMRSWR